MHILHRVSLCDFVCLPSLASSASLNDDLSTVPHFLSLLRQSLFVGLNFVLLYLLKINKNKTFIWSKNLAYITLVYSEAHIRVTCVVDLKIARDSNR